jgi:hypothetical protein
MKVLQNFHKMETREKDNERVRKNTPEQVNKKLDEKTTENILYYSLQPADVIKERLAELDKEWDIERVLELNASVFALGGMVLAFFRSPRWLILPAVVTSFLTQHAIQGWCPPLPLFRLMGFRTRKEIERERYTLREVLDDLKDAEELKQLIAEEERNISEENNGLRLIVVETELEPVL